MKQNISNQENEKGSLSRWEIGYELKWEIGYELKLTTK